MDVAIGVTALKWGAATHEGHVRQINEDAFVADGTVFAVADGMGGYERGEVASAVVADQFRGLAKRTSFGHDEVAEVIRQSHQMIRSMRGRAGEMGTTVAALVLVRASSPASWLVANVGDSRVYRLEHERLEQITMDHSVVQELIDSGQLDGGQALSHPDRHVITRAVGVGDNVVADFALLQPSAGERFLVCSDGVHGQLDVGEISQVLSNIADPQEASESLVKAVLQGRAPDNATCVVVDVISDESAAIAAGDVTDFELGVDEDTSPRPNARGVGSANTADNEAADSGLTRSVDNCGPDSADEGDFIKVPKW